MFAYNINTLKERYSELQCVKNKYVEQLRSTQVVNNFLHHLSTSPKMFYRNVRFEIKITVSHGEVFLFYNANIFKESYEK